MSEEQTGKHAAPDDDPDSDTPSLAGDDGGDHRADGAAEEGDDAGDPDDAHDESGGDDAGSGGTHYPGADPEDADEIEAEREERLDPDNRPDNVEVDNSERDFDAEKGMFTDSEGYEQAEDKFPAIGEQGA